MSPAKKTKKISKAKKAKKAKKATTKPTKKPAAKKKAKKTYDRDSYHLPVRTEDEQIKELSEDLQDAWDRLKETLLALGEQRNHTSHRAIMFSRKTCYAFVRPKKNYLETVFFLTEALDSPLIFKAEPVSKVKFANIARLTHRDQIEAPLTDWLRTAFEQAG